MLHQIASHKLDPKFDRAVLHFGGDKTGSTAIQAVFDDARGILRKEGVAYPPGRFHAQFGSYFCEHPESFIFNVHNGACDRQSLQRLDRAYFEDLSRWLERVEPRRVVVFSYEGFAELDESAMTRMKSFCESIATEVCVLYYVRAPLSYAASAMSQRVKQGHTSWSDDSMPVSPHREFLGKIVEVFGKARTCVRPFSSDRLRNGDVVDDFCDFVGIDPDSVAKAATGERKTNESLSSAALVAGDALIAKIAERSVFIGEAEFYEKYGRHLGGIPGERIRLTPARVGQLLAASREHTDYLASEFGVTIDEDVAAVTRGDAEAAPQDAVFREIGRVMAAVGRQDEGRCADFELEPVSLHRARIDGSGQVRQGDIACFEMKFSVAKPIANLEVGIQLYDDDGRLAFGTNTRILGRPLPHVQPGVHRVRYYVVADLPGGTYAAGFALAEEAGDERRELAWYDRVVTFEIAVPRSQPDIGYASLPTEVDFQRVGEAVGGPIEDGRGRLECLAPLSEVVSGEAVSLPVRLHNASSQAWYSTRRAPIFLSYHWLAQDGATIVFDGERSAVGADAVACGEGVDSHIRIVAPSRPGHYRLLLLPVQEGHHWFDELGFTSASLDVAVRPPRRPNSSLSVETGGQI